ncbi:MULTISPECIES: hypothetical protein [Pectobacterium]|uniref:Uncharacterized protein n=1 Tax=Pectobacterium jejuense TaxID=2974022 RepID=A0ABW8GSK3_9GAMM|nr:MULTISPECIES: hypothetical protein [Pectobacterium]MBN3079758.1 hypothetical protein [Pectobacterium polaris]MCY9847214.1 hypothetical protein [Pectobacterium jejuense]UMO89637.1 hypothetical protein HP572_08990 [Pectobacterium sp. PL64]
MKSSKINQLIDELIGEAVLSLLREHCPISLQALIVKLQAMESHEPNEGRRETIVRIIAEITHNNGTSMYLSPTNEVGEWDEDEIDNVYPLFGGRQQGSSDKKH